MKFEIRKQGRTIAEYKDLEEARLELAKLNASYKKIPNTKLAYLKGIYDEK